MGRSRGSATMLETLPIEAILFVFLLATAVVIARLEDLFAAAMLTGMFSLLSAGMFTLMDAVDVAFTEAAVGAGISTVLILGTLALTERKENQQKLRFMPFLVVVLTGAALVSSRLSIGQGEDAYFVVNRCTVVCVYVSPGRRTVDGNLGWLTESGKCCVSRQRPKFFAYFLPAFPVSEPSR